MPPQAKSPRGPLTQRPPRAAAVPTRRPAHPPRTQPDSRRQTPAQITAERDAAPLRDHGLSLFAIFTLAMLVMVGLAILTAIVGQWWILVPVMSVDLAATTAVLARIAGLLAEGDD